MKKKNLWTRRAKMNNATMPVMNLIKTVFQIVQCFRLILKKPSQLKKSIHRSNLIVTQMISVIYSMISSSIRQRHLSLRSLLKIFNQQSAPSQFKVQMSILLWKIQEILTVQFLKFLKPQNLLRLVKKNGKLYLMSYYNTM